MGVKVLAAVLDVGDVAQWRRAGRGHGAVLGVQPVVVEVHALVLQGTARQAGIASVLSLWAVIDQLKVGLGIATRLGHRRVRSGRVLEHVVVGAPVAGVAGTVQAAGRRGLLGRHEVVKRPVEAVLALPIGGLELGSGGLGGRGVVVLGALVQLEMLVLGGIRAHNTVGRHPLFVRVGGDTLLVDVEEAHRLEVLGAGLGRNRLARGLRALAAFAGRGGLLGLVAQDLGEGALLGPRAGVG